VVTSINGDYITWQDDKAGDYATDHYSELELVMQKGGRTKTKPKLSRQQFQSKSVSELRQIKSKLQRTKLKPIPPPPPPPLVVPPLMSLVVMIVEEIVVR